MIASLSQWLAVVFLVFAVGCDDASSTPRHNDTFSDVSLDGDHSDTSALAPTDASIDASLDALSGDRVDALSDTAGDVPSETILDAGRPAVAFPLTFHDDYLPALRFEIAADDLTALLTAGHAERHPATLHYMGESHRGTIRQRLGNHSRCGDKRQFRFDFSTTVTLPDGYRTDRLETDRGNCYVLHEWLSTYVMRQAAAQHPTLRIMWKRANAAAVYFNDTLYQVQTLTDDTNRDVPERFLGTRAVTLYEAGCLAPTSDAWLMRFCTPMSATALAGFLDVPSFLAWSAVMKTLSPDDNYPDTPWNWYLVRDQRNDIALPLGDDWDSLPASWDVSDTDPYTPRVLEDIAQTHFITLLSDPSLRARYSGYLREARALLDPDVLMPVIDAKFRQIRPYLEATPDPPQRLDWYDFVYTEELPLWLRARYDFLGTAIR